MKFKIELVRMHRRKGWTAIEADSRHEAELQAKKLDETDVESWDGYEEEFFVESVSPWTVPDRPPAEIQEAIRRVVDYLYEDEAEDYQSRTQGEQREHVFGAVLCLARWLTKLEI